MKLRWVLVNPLFLLLAAQAQNQPNIALQAAEATATDTTAGHGANQTVDGFLNTYLESTGSSHAPSRVEIVWKDAVPIQELVIRRMKPQPGAPDLTYLKAETFESGSWHDFAQIGNGKTALPQLLYVRAPEHKAQKLRITGLNAKAKISEIEIYSQRTPAWLDVRGDDRGNIIGVLTDGFGASGIKAEVHASGHAGGKSWKSTATTGPLGDFTLAMPAGLTGSIQFSTFAGGEPILKVADVDDILQGLVPEPSTSSALELDGKWRFITDPPKGFEQPGFDASSWKQIDVPSHWVMDGFQAEKGQGGYRKAVNIPASWRGRRIRIAFDGVYSGAEVWWNGRRVGSHTGGATPFQLDVTDAARPGGDNVIAVCVSAQTIASQMDHMSMYANFSLAGIFRRVRLFSTPLFHVQREQSHAEFDATYKNADFITDISLINESSSRAAAATLRLTLIQGSLGTVVTSEPITIELPSWSKKEQTIKMRVPEPLKWNAEHPNLYTLQTVISQNGTEIERITRKVGFRQTQIEKTSLVIDGVAVKLKGTTHHDSQPLMGRAVTRAIERRDLDLMKEANIDAIRTSHYPPIPELLDIADELGFYVEEEAPFCWVDNAYDLRWGALTRQLASEMVERDLSHPSVAYWSAGNESDWGPTLDLGAREIRAHDPSRPVMGSWTDHLDFTIRHNPMTVAQIHQLDNNVKPVLWDESLAIYQGIWDDGEALWRDPGIRDYYVAPLVDVMNAFWKSKVVQGSFIWSWVDDMFLVPGRGSEYGRSLFENHGVDRIYHMDGRGLVGDAPWGVVDGWRRKKPEFWHIKELYSPIKVAVRDLPIPSSGPLYIPVKNRYFFTNLSELSVNWHLGEREGTVKIDVDPQSSGNIEIPIGSSIRPGSKLELRFLKGNSLVDIVAIRLGEFPVSPSPVLNAPPLRRYDDTLLSGITPRIAGKDFSLGISHGLIKYIVDNGTNILYDQPQIHILPIRDSSPSLPPWVSWSADGPPKISENNGTFTITTRGHYPDFNGSYQTTVTPIGDMTFSYDFEYTGPDMGAKEIGFRIDVPLQLDRLSWLRKGEWTWYPKDHIGALSGDVQAHTGRPPFVVPIWPYAEDDSPMGSNDYRSTKRNIVRAGVRDSSGHGWIIRSDGSQSVRASVKSDRITIYVCDWYGGSVAPLGEYVENYGDGKLLRTGQRIHSTLRLDLFKGNEDRHTPVTKEP